MTNTLQIHGSKIHVIEMWPMWIECHVCGSEDLSGYGIAIYEDQALPDNHQGEWGGVPVCLQCYAVERWMRTKQPDGEIPLSKIRAFKESAFRGVGV